jgi:protein-disulfide isomerase
VNRRRLCALSLAVAAYFSFGLVQSLRADEVPAFAAKLLAAASPLGDHVLGNASAPVVIVEYASATCPHCAEFHNTILPAIKSEFIDSGKVKFVFREFPLDQVAMAVFMLARCLPEDKYFSVIDQLFAKQDIWTKGNKPAEAFKIMESAGMTKPEFDACLKRTELAKSIYEFMQKSSNDFAIKGTPAIYINGKQLTDHKALASVRAAIMQALNQ